MRGLLGLIVMGTVAFFGYGFYDAYAVQKVPAATVRTSIDTWNLLRFDSWDYYGPIGTLTHGDVFIKLFVDNQSDMIIREIVLHGDAMQGGKLIERVDMPCQAKNSTWLSLPPKTNYAKINFDENAMWCFVKLNHTFPSDPRATSQDDDMDAERSRVWALVRSTTLENSWVEVKGSNPPMNAVVWLEEQWKKVSTDVGNAVTYPFQRAPT